MNRGPDHSATGGVRRGGTTAEPVVLLAVHVVPSASRSEIVGLEAETLRVRVAAPPTRGKANKELIKLLAATLGVRKNQVEIVGGEKTRHKRIEVRGISASAALALLQPQQAPGSTSDVSS
jgi:uncharacterized protein (TIGR00251 family)